MLLKVQIPVESGNRAMASGALQQVLQSTMGRLKPEAAYFWAQDGQRGGIMVFDLADTSDIPSISEPFFTQLNATIEFTPVMSAEDLAKGLRGLAAV